MAFGGPRRTPRRFTVYIPSRYTVRPSKAERVVPWVCMGCFGFLFIALLQEFLRGVGPGDEFLVILVFGVLTGICPLFGIGARKTSLEVDGETLVYQGWLRPERRFTFSDIGFVQTKQGRETVSLWAREGWMICRLRVVMDGLDILLADLRSRGALLSAKAPKNRDGPMPLKVPGPRKEETTLDLPARVPDWYCLRNPGLYTLIFALLGGFSGLGAVFSLMDGEWVVSLCFLVFVLGAVGAAVVVRREKVECRGDRFLCCPTWGRAYEVRFDQIAAARFKTVSTGIGPISGVRLLDQEGKTLASPSAGIRGMDILLADMLRRGVPFTY